MAWKSSLYSFRGCRLPSRALLRFVIPRQTARRPPRPRFGFTASARTSTSGAQTSAGPLAGEQPSSSPSYLQGNLTVAEDILLQGSTVPDLLAFDLGTHRHLARGLSSAGEFTPEARVARALRAGTGARLVFAGIGHYQPSSLPLPLAESLLFGAELFCSTSRVLHGAAEHFQAVRAARFSGKARGWECLPRLCFPIRGVLSLALSNGLQIKVFASTASKTLHMYTNLGFRAGVHSGSRR